jgi:hypothetical protein
MTAIDRTAYPRPGARLTREELGVRYDLTEAEIDFVRANARADTSRLLLAVLLKTRRDFGCFPAPRDVHAGIVAHVGAQLELTTPHVPTDELRHTGTLYRYHTAIRVRLRVAPYDDAAKRLLGATILAADWPRRTHVVPAAVHRRYGYPTDDPRRDHQDRGLQ